MNLNSVLLKDLKIGQPFRFDNDSSEAQKKDSVEGVWMIINPGKLLPKTIGRMYICLFNGKDLRVVDEDYRVFTQEIIYDFKDKESE